MANEAVVRRTRKHFKRKLPLHARLARAAQECKQAAQLQPFGPERDALLRAARHYEVTADLDEWLSSPGLQPPT